jgi:ribosomal protein S12 methylthiotransferase accessory factor
MLMDIIPFHQVWKETRNSSFATRSIISFIHFLEQRLGAEFVYDATNIGYESSNMAGVFELAEALRAQGVISLYGRHTSLPDEPRIAYWFAKYGIKGDRRATGSSVDDNRLAFTIALAEAIERYVWFECTDQFLDLRNATVSEITKNKEALSPERFVGYSDFQRENNPQLHYKPSDVFAWVEGYSWTKEKSSWVPAQIVSGHKTLLAGKPPRMEPAIRQAITTGIAVHPKRINALLSGALEVIERDAYIIMWLNQLSLTRIDPSEFLMKSEALNKLFSRCKRYRLEPHIIRLITDAPTYALAVVLEDTTGSLPKFTIGLKAHRDPVRAIEGATFEALRAHVGPRRAKMTLSKSKIDWEPSRKTIDITHFDRMMYWAEESFVDRADRLAFLIKGDFRPLGKEEWEADTDEEHFERIVKWCRKREYELVSVSHTGTAKNVPGWHIEFVVIPELQPMHFSEKLPYVGGKRLHDIPLKFGYIPREPYLDDPHPFA